MAPAEYKSLVGLQIKYKKGEDIILTSVQTTNQMVNSALKAISVEVDTEKASDRNQDSYYHTSIGQSNLNKIFKEDAKGKIRINFNKQKSKFQGGENPGIVPDETKAQTSASIGKDYIGFQIKKKFSRGGGVAIKGLNFKGVF